MDDLLAEFITDTGESLLEVDTGLVHLEQHPGDKAVLNTIFRAIHTIKGTCGFFDLARLEAVSHAAETVLDRFRDAEEPVPAGAFPVLLAAIDRIKLIVAGLKSGEPDTGADDQDIILHLERAANGDFSEPLPNSSSAPQELSREGPEEIDVPVTPGDGADLSQGDTVRVNLSVLDDLMGMVGELVITRNQLSRVDQDQDDSPYSTPLKSLSQIVSGLQDRITLARVQPVQTAWAKLPRIVRDLAHDLDKKINFTMDGGEAELDRQVIEAIKDPLVHMIRNSADHGLEAPENRRKAGKPETGTLRLQAQPEGGYVIIELADDGRGIDLEGVAAKAVSTGLLSEDEAAELTDTQKAELIFHPGLSTSANITAISGRGVGMDVVRANIEKIGGQVEIASTGPTGTVFHLRLPLTLSIVQALIVKADDQYFALAQTDVAELVRAGEGTQYQIDDINGAKMLRLRDEIIPLASLNTCLGLSDPEDCPRPLVLVLRHGTTSLALSVDQVLDTEEIVVKPLTPLLASFRTYSGTTILGDGRVVMILDTGKLIQDMIGMQSDQFTAETAPAGLPEQATKIPLVLFRSGAGLIKAVPLTDIDRLALVEGERIKISADGWVMQHRDQLIPVVSLSQETAPAPQQAVILFRFEAHLVGLAVDEILDIEECELALELTGTSDLVRGLINLDRGPVEIIDLAALAWQIADRLPAPSTEAAA